MLFACPATDDFFRSRIDHMIDLRHPLAVLASRMPWQEIEARVAQVFSRKGRVGVAMPDLDLFGEQVQRTAVASYAGRPRVPLRIMIALLYLRHAFNESDEGVLARWADTPRWQFFSGCAYYEDRLPCDATTLVKFRHLLGEEGVEELLAQTINVAVNLKLIKTEELRRVVVDSTVQHKAIARPTDSQLLETTRVKLVVAAKDADIDLNETLSKATRIVAQSGQRKAADGHPSSTPGTRPRWTASVWGKARTPYEFGVKVGIASTLQGNPYDGHTLRKQLEQASILMQDSAAKPTTPFVDLGHRGVDADNPASCHRAPGQEQKDQRAGQKAAQAAPGLRAHHWPPQGPDGDRLHAVLRAAGYNTNGCCA